VKVYYEDLWERLPAELAVPDRELRRSFLLSELRSGYRVLDLGCGAGEFTAIATEAGAAAIGIDIAEAAVRRARAAHPQLQFVLGEIDGELPFEDGGFELVWASEVIEHVGDTARWLSEARRVLVPGGRLLITTPSHGRLRLLVGGIERYSPPLGDHLHLYSRASLAALLGDFGFTEVRVRSAGGAPLMRATLLARAVL
jgi:SAM-dependent methyltransferase